MSLKALDLLAGLTPKQRRFLQEYRGEGDGARAARAAGYSSKRANTAAWAILNNPKVREAINEALDEVGLDIGAVFKTTIEGINAEAVKIASHEGKITDVQSFPDYQVRHKYLETLIKLRDLYPADKLDMTVNKFTDWSDEELKHYVATGQRPEGK